MYNSLYIGAQDALAAAYPVLEDEEHNSPHIIALHCSVTCGRCGNQSRSRTEVDDSWSFMVSYKSRRLMGLGCIRRSFVKTWEIGKASPNEPLYEDTRIRDKSPRMKRELNLDMDKSPRLGEDFSLGKDKTLREFILIPLGVPD
ncbi:hypothetical protein TEA_017703 [Camellia sinensis var. sinensis]|uniref:Uncharacterized protein n=1 Tax=Camellia sinensis var. sinensis TaxID=542762 RepID=A0A4S4CZ47_CAMSN|nr:hypothetical protein TEA_017703 [Camellia sinensis var. sinensis]